MTATALSLAIVAAVVLLLLMKGGISRRSAEQEVVSLPAIPDEPSVLTIAMHAHDGTRPGRFTRANTTKDLSPEDFRKDPDALARRVFDALQPERLVKKGRLQAPDISVDFYLPEATEPYRLVNQGESDADHENTSTLISIDANDDGKLTEEEGWFANLPVRIGDSMWKIESIAADGSEIKLKPSPGPLRGVVVGRKCPPFSYETEGGGRVSQETYTGKTLIIDIWSLT
jgi:hypothetical protein